ncbi:MAG: hypothetical protein VKO65_03710 [Cyanobacteriota bacterium]|nr:hypothetical protein [Cyanobacteriota bacterium]
MIAPEALAWLQRLRTWRRPGPLGVALLAALIAHALILAHAQLRRGQADPQAPATAAIAPDDTPELLRFSRRSAQPPSFSTLPIPMPPPAALPPPPPDFAAGDPAGDAEAGAAPSRPPAAARRPPRRGGAAPRAQGSAARGERRSTASSSGSRGPGRRPVAPARREAAADQSASPAAAQLAAARASLESLQIAPASGGQASAQALWEQATPRSEATLAEGQELRRLPAEAVRSLGLAAGTRLILRGDDGRSLVIWLEGDQAWLLRGPAGGRSDGDTPAAAG